MSYNNEESKNMRILSEEAFILSQAARYKFHPESCYQIPKLNLNAANVYAASVCKTKDGRRFYCVYVHQREYRSLRVRTVTLSESQFLESSMIQDGNITYIGDISIVW